MTADKETLAVYDRQAEDYADVFASKTPDGDLRAFMDEVIEGGRVLDFGCGPGNSAAMMRDAGFVAEATDGSPEMARLALDRYGIEVRVEPFSALNAEARYDGIWANFSLLHAPRGEMPDHLSRLNRALVPGGLLHLGLKLGVGEARDHLGRLYTYFSEEELRDMLASAGFTVTRVRLDHSIGLAGTDDPFIIIGAHA